MTDNCVGAHRDDFVSFKPRSLHEGRTTTWRVTLVARLLPKLNCRFHFLKKGAKKKCRQGKTIENKANLDGIKQSPFWLCIELLISFFFSKKTSFRLGHILVRFSDSPNWKFVCGCARAFPMKCVKFTELETFLSYLVQGSDWECRRRRRLVCVCEWL